MLRMERERTGKQKGEQKGVFAGVFAVFWVFICLSSSSCLTGWIGIELNGTEWDGSFGVVCVNRRIEPRTWTKDRFVPWGLIGFRPCHDDGCVASFS